MKKDFQQLLEVFYCKWTLQEIKQLYIDLKYAGAAKMNYLIKVTRPLSLNFSPVILWYTT